MDGNILVTGGSGYIGSHTVVQLLNAGLPVVVFDNLCNSKRIVIDCIQKIAGQRVDFIEGDIRDRRLASGHLAALKVLTQGPSRMMTVNLGTGRPHSVLEVVAALEKASGRKISYEIVSRRAGDLAAYYADPRLAHDILGWKANHGIDRMCQDTWQWQKNHPEGYA